MDARKNGRHRKNGRAAVILSGLVLAAMLGYDAQARRQQRGDAITGFRVVDIVENPTSYWHWDVRLEVDYTYRPFHKEVIVGGALLSSGGDLQSGHSYWAPEAGPSRAVEERKEGSIIKGMQRVCVAVRLNAAEAVTRELRL